MLLCPRLPNFGGVLVALGGESHKISSRVSVNVGLVGGASGGLPLSWTGVAGLARGISVGPSEATDAMAELPALDGARSGGLARWAAEAPGALDRLITCNWV